MSDQKNYIDAELDELITQSSTIQDNVSTISEAIDTNYSSLDSRIQRKYKDILDKMNAYSKTLKDGSTDAQQYSQFINTTTSDYQATKAKTEAIANNAGQGVNGFSGMDSNSVGIGSAGAASIGALDSLIKETIGGLGNANTLEYTFDPEAFEELPSEVQEVIKTKLKELGFTDDEIKDILNGKVPVSKLELDTLSGELEEVLKANPDIRAKLVELYGFDIFNEDGTINKDRLALAMIMDGKDPNDKYDLKEFLKKYQQNESTGNKPSPTPTTGNEGDNNSDNTNTPNIIGGTIPNTSNDENNGTGSTGNTISNTHGTNDITNTSVDGVVSTDENGLSLDDTASSLTTSIEHGEILPTGNTKVKKGGMGAVAAMTGIGSAIAAAAGGTALAKKKKSENEEEEEDIELLTEERYMNDDDTDESEENDKDWLYGLGIGLVGGAGLSQILPDDDDDDEDDDDSDELLSEDEFYPHF